MDPTYYCGTSLIKEYTLIRPKSVCVLLHGQRKISSGPGAYKPLEAEREIRDFCKIIGSLPFVAEWPHFKLVGDSLIPYKKLKVCIFWGL